MPIRYTKRVKAEPLRFNGGRTGLSSVSAKLGPVTLRLWSRRYKPGISSVDLPGPFSERPTPRRKGSAR